MSSIIGLTLRLAAIIIGAALTGCASKGYVIEGRAVRAEYPTITFVTGNDGRLAGQGVPNVEVFLYRDPDKPSRELVARGVTDGDGYLSLPVAAFGAGWMVEQWMVYTYRPGYQSSTTFVTLPRREDHMQLLMMLGPGRAEPPPPDSDALDLYERFK